MLPPSPTQVRFINSNNQEKEIKKIDQIKINNDEIKTNNSGIKTKNDGIKINNDEIQITNKDNNKKIDLPGKHYKQKY